MNISTLQKGLVAHWKLSESSFNPATKRFSDSTPHGNHGTGHGTKLGSATPGFLADRMGQAGLACPFGGIDDYIDCGNDASLDITEAITVSAWVNIKEAQSEIFSSIVGKWETTSDERCYWLAYSESGTFEGISFFISDHGINYEYARYIPTVFEEWMLITGTFDGSNIRIYEDGILKDTTAFVSTINSEPTKECVIGGRKDAVDRLLDGSIAEIRIYNRALSPSEALLLSQIYRPGVLI